MNRRVLLLAAALPLAGCDYGKHQDFMVGQLASDRIEIAAEFSEPVTTRPVSEGQAVHKGELLVQQDTARIDARIREAEAAVHEIQGRLDELMRGPRHEQIDAARASVAGAEKDVAYQKLEYQRAVDVRKKNLAAPETVDRSKAALDAAEAALAVNEARLEELLAGTTIEELRQVEQAHAQAEARLDGLRVDRERHAAIAPSDGMVDVLLFEPGEKPQPGQPLAVMLAGSQPYARIYVPESQRVHVAPGAMASIRVDGLDGELRGRVRWVASDAAFTPYFALTEHDRGRLSYVAKIDIERSGHRLPDGVPVEVTLDAARPAH